MHRFLRAVGFSRIKERKDLDNLLGRIMNQPDKKIKYLFRPEKHIQNFPLISLPIPASVSVENMMKKASFLWNIIILFAKADL